MIHVVSAHAWPPLWSRYAMQQGCCQLRVQCMAAGLCSSAGECGAPARGAARQTLCPCALGPAAAVVLLNLQGACAHAQQVLNMTVGLLCHMEWRPCMCDSQALMSGLAWRLQHLRCSLLICLAAFVDALFRAAVAGKISLALVTSTLLCLHVASLLVPSRRQCCGMTRKRMR